MKTNYFIENWLAYFYGVANPDNVSIDGCLSRWLDTSVPAMAYPAMLNKIPVYTSCIAVLYSVLFLISTITTLLS